MGIRWSDDRRPGERWARPRGPIAAGVHTACLVLADYSGQCVAVTDPASWHEEMRGRAFALLVSVDDRLPQNTAQLAHELIDANEYGVAVEIMRDVLAERQAPLTADEERELQGMLGAMGLGLPDP